jgi:hypothetical protein
MPLKADLPRWATGGGASVTEPSSGDKDDGWNSSLTPVRDHANWKDRQAYTALLELYQDGGPKWYADYTYPVDAIVRGSDGAIYQCILESTNHDPTTDGGTHWFNRDSLTYSGEYMTAGGTANAITLTTAYGTPVTELSVGMQFRFTASTLNTGASTINVDGVGAVTVKTVTGADTPAGYIRDDVYTTVIYDGTNFVANRSIERGSNSNGDYIRFEDGTQICTFRGTTEYTTDTALGSVYVQTGLISLTYAAAFTVLDDLIVSPIRTGGLVWGGIGQGGLTDTGNISVVGATNTATAYMAYTAIGKWY